jgi:hypothetical protein
MRLVDEHGDALTQARRAHAAGDWSSAAARYDAVSDQQLTADDRAARFEALWWLGRSEDSLRVGASAYEALLADSRPLEAVRVAMLVVLTLLARGDEPQAHGWAGRARRVLQEIPEAGVHGLFLLLTDVVVNLWAGKLEPASAVDAARRVQDMGRRFDDPDLVAVALYCEGHALLKLGQAVDGLARLDEAMLGVLDGRVASVISGALYCYTIGACHEVADVRRMSRWTELAERWLASRSVAFWYDGICRVYRAELSSCAASGMKPNVVPSKSRRSSMATTFPTRRKPGTSWVRCVDCVATRALPTRISRRMPEVATRNPVGHCYGSSRAILRVPRCPCDRPWRPLAATR